MKPYKCHLNVVGVSIGVGIDGEHELTGDKCRDLLNELSERTERQRKELEKLYKLIVDEDWESLKEIKTDMYEVERKLKQEDETYSKALYK